VPVRLVLQVRSCPMIPVFLSSSASRLQDLAKQFHLWHQYWNRFAFNMDHNASVVTMDQCKSIWMGCANIKVWFSMKKYAFILSFCFSTQHYRLEFCQFWCFYLMRSTRWHIVGLLFCQPLPDECHIWRYEEPFPLHFNS
jgi:hypothetical protein